MKPRPRPKADQLDLFQAHFDQILNPDHPLVVLANKIDWQRFDGALADCYCPDNGAPAKSARLLVGLHYLVIILELLRILLREILRNCHYLILAIAQI